MRIVPTHRFVVKLPQRCDRFCGRATGECKPSQGLTPIEMDFAVRSPCTLRVALGKTIQFCRTQSGLRYAPEFEHELDTFAEANGYQSCPPSALAQFLRLFKQPKRGGFSPSVHSNPREHEIGSPGALKYS